MNIGIQFKRVRKYIADQKALERFDKAIICINEIHALEYKDYLDRLDVSNKYNRDIEVELDRWTRCAMRLYEENLNLIKRINELENDRDEINARIQESD